MYAELNGRWDQLIRLPNQHAHTFDVLPTPTTLLKLPHPYVVPGGRFREIYYWDSYFTLLGLYQSKRFNLAKNMVDNFAYLIDQFGHIPNGNRSYFLSRSKPPFFGEMIRLIDQYTPEIVLSYLPQLEKEYQFWMKEVDQHEVGYGVLS